MDILWLLVLPIAIILLARGLFARTRSLEPIEKVGWIAGTVGVAIALLAWVMGDIPFIYRVIIGVVALVILIVTAIWSKFSGKESSEYPTTHIPESSVIRAEDVEDFEAEDIEGKGRWGHIVSIMRGKRVQLRAIRGDASVEEQRVQESERTAIETDAQVHGQGKRSRRRDTETDRDSHREKSERSN